ncbi:hypothetical protein [Jannaschia seohaensis]|uniref:DUF4157 domain-containing protein n=1 Tax=Jannaschia seohaensis TaxID=475081 RepID=A0A2Y9B2B1_9RHOB|nr:hypothetical protein [Jannaschia seohaensis]PWJ13338.1 hypothetical protein BCF38_114101 [Jannaschia seohaensis]SSA50664.1 hypothetical protein SAMN05421539_114101 [Jannaschia seohaensis]
MRIALLLLVALAACGRPVTEGERALTAPLHGPTLDIDRVRIQTQLGIGAFPITYDARPRTTCRERIGPPQTGRITARTGGIVLYERLLLSPAIAFEDFARFDRDGRLDLPAAMFFVHEMTHVWQWQNRDVTGYHPSRAFAEQMTIDDPYLFREEPGRRFLDFGYEVQASLVEEYLCCAVLHPEGARTHRLKELLRQVMPVADPQRITRPAWVPYEEDIPGICA